MRQKIASIESQLIMQPKSRERKMGENNLDIDN